MDTKILPNETYTIGYLNNMDDLIVLATLNNSTAKMPTIKFTVLVNDTVEYFSSALGRDDIYAYPRQDAPDTTEA